MKATLQRMSLVANLFLAAVIGWLFIHRPVSATENPSPPPAAVITPTAHPVTAADENSERMPPPFRWNQLESTNYPVYIANLRSVGCPEQTIREIVTAEIHDIYEGFRQELRKSPLPGAALAAGLAQLQREEAAVLSELLGAGPALPELASADAGEGAQPTDQPAAAPVSPPERYRLSVERRLLARPVTMPIVFQPVDPAAMKLSDDQLNVIKDLQQKFLLQVGGTNQDPNDPEYLKRWQAAQISADEWFSALLGRDFRMKYQAQAMSRSQRTQLQN